MKHARQVIESRQQSPWPEMVRADVREWWRDHRGATFSEFAEWIDRRYLPLMEASMGFRAGFRPGPLQQSGLDDVHRTAHALLQEDRERRERRHRSAA